MLRHVSQGEVKQLRISLAIPAAVSDGRAPLVEALEQGVMPLMLPNERQKILSNARYINA